MHSPKQKTNFGFTLVELLIAVVVMAILASITIAVYDGTHERARDTRRSNDIVAIKEALETYRATTGVYPSVPDGPYGGWDSSADSDGFLTALKTAGYLDTVPLDPTNTAPTSGLTTGYRYQYYRYSDTSYLSSKGCATNRGALAVLMVVSMEVAGKPAPDSPGFSCSGRNFNSEGAWVWGDYEKAE